MGAERERVKSGVILNSCISTNRRCCIRGRWCLDVAVSALSSGLPVAGAGSVVVVEWELISLLALERALQSLVAARCGGKSGSCVRRV